MISLLDVNVYACMSIECLKFGDKVKGQEILTSLESKMADRKQVLDKLSAKAESIGSDNLWNRYESADEAYGYADELSYLLNQFLWGDEEYDNLEWQIDDIASKSKSEAFYRLEKAQ